MEIKISVIVPVYNGEQYLRQCLESILQQSLKEFELIIVDDGSTDSSAEIALEYETLDERIRVIRQEHADAGTARNTGMQYAQGKYLSFLDADDFFDKYMLMAMYESAEESNSDIVVVGSDEYFDATGRYRPSPGTIRTDLLPDHQPFSVVDVAKDRFRLFIGWHWDKLFRREFILDNGLRFQALHNTEDLFFVFSAIVKAEKISIQSQVLAHHRILTHGKSLSQRREQSWGCFYHALTALREQLKEWGYFQLMEADFVNYSLYFALWHLDTLKGSAYEKLYNQLKDSWFCELGILDKEKNYFYDPWYYNRLQLILSIDPLDYVMTRVDEFIEMTEEQRNRLLELQRELTNKQKTIEMLTAQNDQLMNSRTYRIGLFFSRPYRWLKSLFKKHKVVYDEK